MLLTRAPLAPALVAAALCACGGGGARASGVALTLSASALGPEGRLLRAQLDRFARAHPGVTVTVRATPDAADQRHQRYVQWLNAGAREPDVLQLDVVWTPEFAAAGWVLPLDRFGPDVGDFFEGVVAADRVGGRLYAVPWFVDVGMLYYRTDLTPRAPATLDALAAEARRLRAARGLPYGFVWQGQRYEGLVCTFAEALGAYGGAIVDARGEVTVDAEPAVRALTFLRDAVRSGASPLAVTTWQEEQARFAFQNGQAAFMRNWPYARALLDDPAASRVAGRVAVAPMPAAPGGEPTATLGGARLAVNARTAHPREAWALVEFLTAPAQMAERAEAVGQLPARRSPYDDPRVTRALGADAAALRAVVERARPRPVTPLYSELSALLQVRLHRALTGQEEPRAALADAARAMRAVVRARGPDAPPPQGGWRAVALALAALAVGALAARRMTADPDEQGPREERRAAAWLVAPAAVALAAVAVAPLAWTAWESLHGRDLRAPWRGAPYVGLANYAEALGDARVRAALGHTAFFVAASVTLELAAGLALALALDGARRAKGAARVVALVPWAMPTVVAALVWRFLFDAPAGAVNGALLAAGAVDRPVVWLAHEAAAWVPLVLADAWKSTPFVALLLYAGLQGIDPALDEAARVDGATRWQRFWRVTLPLLRPSIGAALLLRALDAFRVFDMVYALTGGGPGTATEPVALLTFDALLQDLRFGYGAALSVLVFAGAFALAAVITRLTRATSGGPP